MNPRLRFVAWLLLIVISTSGHSFGRDRTKRDEPDGSTSQNFESVAVDVVVARPLWFAATVVGGALFVVSLPVAALSKSVDQTAKTLVVKPAHATFKRPLGDFSSVE